MAYLDEHDLADEKIPEFGFDIQVVIGFLFERQFDMQADGTPSGLLCPLVGGLHESGAATCDNIESASDQVPGQLACDVVNFLIGS